MFLQGFMFAMGFGIGSMVLAISSVLLVMGLERILTRIRRRHLLNDKVVDIGPWQLQQSTGTSSSAGYRPAS